MTVSEFKNTLDKIPDDFNIFFSIFKEYKITGFTTTEDCIETDAGKCHGFKLNDSTRSVICYIERV